jgi:DNA-binding response OmpR family regulator
MQTPHALIIEDDEKLAIIFSKAFEMASFSVNIAWDGNAAMKQLKETCPDVVVLDLHLPYVSGIEILEQIRADTRLAKCRVVVVTADLFKAESLKADADLVLIKPISFNQLRDLANRLYSSEFN